MTVRDPLKGGILRQGNGRWFALGAGITAQASVSSLQQGLPALGPALRDAFDLSLPALGALLAAAGWGIMLTVYIWGLLSDHIGERLVVVAGLAGASLALIGASYTETAVGLGLAIACAGAMSGAAIAASGRAIMGWFPRSERGFALGLRQMAVPLGAGFSALVLPWAAINYGLQAAFLALAGLALAGVLAALLWLKPAPVEANLTQAHLRAKAPIRDSAIWRLSSASAMIHWSQAATNAFLVVILMEQQGLSYALAAALFGVVQILSGIVRILAGWISDRKGGRIPHLIYHTTGICVLLFLAALLLPYQSLWACGILVCATVAAAGWNGLAFAAVAEFGGHNRAGSALGLHATLMRILTFPAAIAFGFAAAEIGWSYALVALLFFPAIGAIMLVPLLAEEARRRQV